MQTYDIYPPVNEGSQQNKDSHKREAIELLKLLLPTQELQNKFIPHLLEDEVSE